MSGKPRVAVVGAGIVGASIAYHLARRGADVTIIEQNCPASGVTAKAFAWINVSHGVAGPNAPLRVRALDEYRRLDDELGGTLPIDWCGALTWTRDPTDSERMVRDHVAHGHELRLVDARGIAALEPGLAVLPEAAAYAPGEGGIDPVAATDLLIRAAREAGAQLLLSSPVHALATEGGRVVGAVTKDGAIAADCVVMAAGLGSVALCAPLGVVLPVDASPAILVRLRASQRLVRRILASPTFEVRQPAAGLFLAAEDYVDDSAENGPNAVARRTLAELGRQLRGGDSLAIEEASAGVRPMPRDDLPIVGRLPSLPGLYVAVMHAGIVMAPVVGRLAAAEICDDAIEPALDHCRPDRFGAD
jgi:glycine/D-amino acid oxidase-like deaminating enzyme